MKSALPNPVTCNLELELDIDNVSKFVDIDALAPCPNSTLYTHNPSFNSELFNIKHIFRLQSIVTRLGQKNQVENSSIF